MHVTRGYHVGLGFGTRNSSSHQDHGTDGCYEVSVHGVSVAAPAPGRGIPGGSITDWSVVSGV